MLSAKRVKRGYMARAKEKCPVCGQVGHFYMDDLECHLDEMHTKDELVEFILELKDGKK